MGDSLLLNVEGFAKAVRRAIRRSGRKHFEVAALCGITREAMVSLVLGESATLEVAKMVAAWARLDIRNFIKKGNKSEDFSLEAVAAMDLKLAQMRENNEDLERENSKSRERSDDDLVTLRKPLPMHLLNARRVYPGAPLYVVVRAVLGCDETTARRACIAARVRPEMVPEIDRPSAIERQAGGVTSIGLANFLNYIAAEIAGGKKPSGFEIVRNLAEVPDTDGEPIAQTRLRDGVTYVVTMPDDNAMERLR